jgi:RHS repeat-associated protein
MGLAQVLATSDGAVDVYGLQRIGEKRDGAWAYALGDALGSLRQWTDDGASVSYAVGYTPFGVELWEGGSTASAWGFTGEWFDSALGQLYLRARSYAPTLGRFTARDPWFGDVYDPSTLVQDYAYVQGNPLRWVDPTGMVGQRWWENMLRNPHWRQVFLDSAARHNHGSTGLDNLGFAAVLASVVLIEGGHLGGDSPERWKAAISRIIGPRAGIVRIPIVACVKRIEIAYNSRILPYRSPRWLDPSIDPIARLQQLVDPDGEGMSEGIVNINPEAIGQAQAAPVEIYRYDTSELYRGLAPLLRVWRGQEQWIEYLAASFEMVTIRAENLGVSLEPRTAESESGETFPESVRAFSQWHKEGMVQAFGEEGNWWSREELAKSDSESWVNGVLLKQEDANDYFNGVARHWWAARKGLEE